MLNENKRILLIYLIKRFYNNTLYINGPIKYESVIK